MKRVLLLVTVALMLAAAMALAGVAQAAPISGKANAQCAKLAIKTLGPSFNPSNYTFIGGTEGEDDFDGRVTASPDVFCGFGGNDYITDVDAGDVLLGGAGNDSLQVNRGTVYGQEGDDYVVINIGTFYGGPGNDDLQVNTTTGIFVQD